MTYNLNKIHFIEEKFEEKFVNRNFHNECFTVMKFKKNIVHS